MKYIYLPNNSSIMYYTSVVVNIITWVPFYGYLKSWFDQIKIILQLYSAVVEYF